MSHFTNASYREAFAEARRIVAPSGLGAIVFASKTTTSWEAILQAVVNAGWTITGSWPLDTEREGRLACRRAGAPRFLGSPVCSPTREPDSHRHRRCRRLAGRAFGATAFESTHGCRGWRRKASLGQTPFLRAWDLGS